MVAHDAAAWRLRVRADERVGGRGRAVHGLRSGAVCPRHRLAAGSPAAVAVEEVPGGVPVLPGVRYLCRHPRPDPRGECGQCRAGRFHCEEHRRGR